ncbi:leucine-rich repeat neuronal protein 3 [Protopterus annectens]|uniref:leucine-rich repeat neuronal protein 3 n=1 Tax=Protopterus annectens TaxID=7888 RepID=UPI001CFA4D3C|nr:leucine-rich repeat neuronal protein 3 [Protopterus annectens]XP_043944743.1 leucine-rich repeat neuronal protein 3 [Protopterus annectens]XP_043944744.1 leucine-rich repeat neuronal protein 3 [Protopterus annectens]XP_043944745.1 leucine-rich repeat neuronal protein 3 [Protopterus annectens]
MNDMALKTHFLVSLTIAALVQAVEKIEECPQSCTCEIRPWFTPRSTYIEVPTVDCNDLGLYNFPLRLPVNTQILLLQTNNIAKIDHLVDYLVNLTELDLSQNNLSSVTDITLGQMYHLLSLHLEENKLTELPDQCFSGLPNLQELYINHNLIFTVMPEAFMGLDNLLRLHLNSNKLRIINRKWFDFTPNLEILSISENPIIQIEESNFKPLNNLRSLVLASIYLSDLPHDALIGLDNLESVSLYDNKFLKVPSGALQKAINLKFLDLNKNPIQRIQKGDFRDMFHLKELGINYMPELVSIDSLALDNLPELTKIEATNNPRLSYIHPNAFSKLPKLESLMLNSNALSALYRSTIDSLPNLREVSIHSNPIRCDCVIRWINMNKTKIRFMEPDFLFCVDPPEFEGQHVRQIHFREMMEICLPLIAPESFPLYLDLNLGDSVSLHCRAIAEPEPEIYWITPTGQKLLPNMVSDKLYVYPEGTLDIYGVTEKEAGLYTCVATNLIGADLKTVKIKVGGECSQVINASVSIKIKDVHSNSVLLSWTANSKSLTSSINWTATVKDGNPQIAHTARVPSDTKVFNLTHLNPATEYEICIDISNIHQQNVKKCINVTTNGTDFAIQLKEKSNVTPLVAGLGTLLWIVAMIFLFNYKFQKTDCDSGKLFLKYYMKKTTYKLHELYPSPISLWDTSKGRCTAVQVKATVINVPNNVS